MKRLILFLLTAVLCLGMISCGNSNQTQDPSDQSSKSTTQEEITTIGITQEETTTTSEALPKPDTGSVESIVLSYCGNPNASITITDPQIIATLLSYMKNANGVKGKSSRGYYGVLYFFQIFTADGEEYFFELWNETDYIASHTEKDEYGYYYFYSADMSEMYNYLTENYPSDFWY